MSNSLQPNGLYTVHGILQAGILEWVTFPFSRDLPNPGIESRSPALQADALTSEPPGKTNEWVQCHYKRDLTELPPPFHRVREQYVKDSHLQIRKWVLSRH